MKTYKSTKLFRHGEHLAEVEVELRQHEGRDYPTLSLDDVRKLEKVRKALREGQFDEVAKLAKLYKIAPFQTGTDAA